MSAGQAVTNCDHDWIAVKRRGRLNELVDARMCKTCGLIEDVPPTTPPREQKPGDGRKQEPRRNEEKRPL